MQHIAIIDIGSNSVRMVIFDYAHKQPIIIFNERVFCGLARDLDKTKKLNKSAVKIAVTALQGFVFLAKARGIKKIITIGTAALREAADSKKFIDTVYKKTKLKIKIIKGTEEAHYAARGVLVLNPKAKGYVADFGGGSLEIAEIKNNQIKNEISFALGAFRVLPYIDTAYEYTRDTMHNKFKPTSSLKNLYVIGGSWRSLLSAHAMDHNHHGKIQDYQVSKISLTKFCKKIEKMSEAQLIKKYRLENHRATLFKVSSIILRATIDTLKVDTIIASHAGIRDGVLYDVLKVKNAR